jgi:hypothetical protein
MLDLLRNMYPTSVWLAFLCTETGKKVEQELFDPDDVAICHKEEDLWTDVRTRKLT